MPEIQWRGFDPPSTETCALRKAKDGWRLEGEAVIHGPHPGTLTYAIALGPAWVTRSARVTGALGARRLDLAISRSAAGVWAVNGTPHPQLAPALDIDLGFSPATNTCVIRRLGPGRQGQRPVIAAWLDTEDWVLKPLRQVYELTGPLTWAYRSPTTGFSTELTVNNDGFVTDYPGLWAAVPQEGGG